MCGIVGAVAARDVVPDLLNGLRRLEYRGYDSAGIAVLANPAALQRVRAAGKVAELVSKVSAAGLSGRTGIAHTRWATHGRPNEANAHPHVVADALALVHNGIVENHAALKQAHLAAGHVFTSDTDTEVLAHEIYRHYTPRRNLLLAVRAAAEAVQGSYAIAVIENGQPDHMVVARRGSPLVVGLGQGENFVASDVTALLPVTQQFLFLEDGDTAEVTRDTVTVYDQRGALTQRVSKRVELRADAAEKGPFRHYMLKEIFEQPLAIANTLEGRLAGDHVLDGMLGFGTGELLDGLDGIQFIACGTSYHAALVAKYWIEWFARIPCCVDIASEFRYRHPVARQNALVIAISQSGETADTLAAVRAAKQLGFTRALAICNVPESSLARESNSCLMTRAGPEIGVASTKAFTTQLVALLLLTLVLAAHRLAPSEYARAVADLRKLPAILDETLASVGPQVQSLAPLFAAKSHALFLGRGVMYPIAMEGALKLKEISYIHAEAYAAGELKHGPLALVDGQMPVVAVAPNDELLEKLKSNMQEVSARGGQLYVFADRAAGLTRSQEVQIIDMPSVDDLLAPIVHTVPLQLLAYHVAVLKGTDVDQPRNLAKSVTVE
jgi:glucosamine--fructose-6-phosphate aminotransferase (isomerizing)